MQVCILLEICAFYAYLIIVMSTKTLLQFQFKRFCDSVNVNKIDHFMHNFMIGEK